jgi:hypothetical protein
MEKINKSEKKLLKKVEKATEQVFKEDDFENTGNPGESHNNNICCQGCYKLGIAEGKRQEKDIKADHLAGHYIAGKEEGIQQEQKRIIEIIDNQLKEYYETREMNETKVYCGEISSLEVLKQQIQEEKKQ